MCKITGDIHWFFPDTLMTKESYNLIGQDHFGNITWVFVYKINEIFLYQTIFTLNSPLRWSKNASGEFTEIWVWLGKAGHTN